MEKSIAIIDLGSNSIRMNIIAINKNGGYSIYEQASEMVRIMPFKCLFERIGSPEIRISANGLREVYFYEKYFESIDMPIVVSDVLKHSKENFLKRFVVNEPHARKVQSIAT